MKTKNLKQFGKLFILFILVVSCSPEDGKDGIQGPTGTANVMYSNWMNQSWNLSNDANTKTMGVTESMANNAFFNNGGIVLGYFKVFSNTIYPLAYEDNSFKNLRKMYAVHFETEGSIRFIIESTDGTALTNTELNGSTADYNPQFRYVLIPGGTNISGRVSSKVDYSKMSYKEICKLFNIPE
jgi:hypothetical protein